MRIHLPQNVLEAALARIRWIFAEFPDPIVCVSGGKDSTVVFNLSLQVARELGRLPLKVSFIDQEAEWEATIEQVREIMGNPDVQPLWYQMPLRLFNATSTTDHWLQCWDPNAEDRWMRPKEPGAIKDNVYGTDRFVDLFNAIIKHDYPDSKACYIVGMRAEESPNRALGMIRSLGYKDVTWCRAIDRKREHFNFYPIYDWSYMDVWKAIHEHGWPYNAIYDAQYSYGIPVMSMRVSNVHHETAVHALFYMQEVEPQTYAKLTQRISGIDMAGKLGTDDYFIKELPFMFKSWAEYRDYLVDKLIDNPDWQAGFRRAFAEHDRLFGEDGGAVMYRVHINSLLTNDWEHIKLKNWKTSMKAFEILKKRGHRKGTAWNQQ